MKNISIDKLVVLLCMFSLSPFAVGETMTVQYGTEVVTVYKDISYGPDRSHEFDVYTRDGLKDAPVIFMVHGGAWKLGDKESKSVVQNKVGRWLPSGFVFISINYRLLPRASDPIEQAKDVSKALILAQQRAPSWGGSSDKFILMGHSAGAHLVGLVSGSVREHISMGGKGWLGAVLLDSAALNVPAIMNQKHYGFYDDAFGADPDFWMTASPFHQLKKDAPPMLITCSSDRKGACSQAYAFKAQADLLAVRAAVISQNLSHKEMNEDLGDKNDYTVKVESFLGSLDAQIQAVLSNRPSLDDEPRKGLIRRWIEKRQASK